MSALMETVSRKSSERVLTRKDEIERTFFKAEVIDNEQLGGGNFDTMGPTNIRDADRSGEEGDVGDFDEVRRNQKCFNRGTPSHFVRDCRWKGKDTAVKTRRQKWRRQAKTAGR